MRYRFLSGVVAMLSFTFPYVAAAQPDNDQAPEIRPLRGDLYQVRVGSRVAVFAVTPAGIVVVDPLGRATAMWLREELMTRFPGQLVRFVVNSHHHFDRAEGGYVFPDAQVVAHREFDNNVDAARRSLPEFVGLTDANHNGAFDASELTASPEAAGIASRDRNSDGRVTPQELYVAVRPARTTYSRRFEIKLADKTIQLIHPGPAFATDMTAVYFPAERLLFAADGPPVNTAPFLFGQFRPRDVFEWIHTLAALDFDELLFGDGSTMTHTDLVELRDYLDDIRARAAEAYEQGQSLAALQLAGIDRYTTSRHYPGRSMQVSAIYRTIRVLKLQVFGAAATNYDKPAGCESFTVCSVGGAVPAATGGLTFLFSRSHGVAGEVTLEQQTWNTRTRPSYTEEIALRQARGSLLWRFSPPTQSPLSLALLVGPSITFGDLRGVTRVEGKLVPTGGRHLVHSTESRTGFTVGGDFVLGRQHRFVIPIRVTLTPSVPMYWPSHVNLRAGVGINTGLIRHIN